LYIWADPSYQANGENGRLRGLTADCSGGASLPVYPGPDAPTQSSLQVEGITGVDGQYGTYLNE
jgi:hypothetical protein